jgi:hypothetical protein
MSETKLYKAAVRKEIQETRQILSAHHERQASTNAPTAELPLLTPKEKVLGKPRQPGRYPGDWHTTGERGNGTS